MWCGCQSVRFGRGDALIQACRFPHPGIVKALLLKGADPNITSEDGLQLAPLHIAAAHKRSVEKKQNALACAELLLNHGADVNQRIFATEKTPLRFVGPHTQPQLLALLLSRGADPLAEAYDGELPRLGPAHFRGLGTHLTAALENGNSRQVDRWITVVEGFLPDPEAASLLVEWAPLCIHDGKLANRIHTGIEHFLTMIDGDPPVEVLRYVACHNARETREEVLSKLKVAELTPVGMRDEFGIIGNYAPAEHGLLLIELASSWAQDPTEDHMVHVMAILKFVASSAAGAPRTVRVALHNEAVKLQSELFNNAVPELVERASSVRDFLGQGPFALDKLE
jgi:Ankyrin repeats (3 copies)